MRFRDILCKKKDGKKLTTEEISFMVEELTRGNIPDYQMSAMLMAITINGMDDDETAALTIAMKDSGRVMDLTALKKPVIDKHSTGGVGDTSNLVLVPMAAALGISVPKIPGRGLGHTGGTIDKYESIKGFTADLSEEEFISIIQKCGSSIVGWLPGLAPADKKMFALRDVTETVESMPLIVSSIMSKKLAVGADAIVIDVKTGRGSLVPKYETSLKTSEMLVDIGARFGKDVCIIITTLDEPLGFAIGNALEVKEAVELLHGRGPADLHELCVVVTAYMMLAGHLAGSFAEAREKCEEVLRNGAAFEHFKQMVQLQHGDLAYVDNLDLLPKAHYTYSFRSDRDGYVQQVDPREIGGANGALGAGREKIDYQIDRAVGMILRKKIGDTVHKGDELVEVHYNDPEKFKVALEKIRAAYVIGDEKPIKRNLVVGVIDKSGIHELQNGMVDLMKM